MNINELMEAIARKFSELGADLATVRYYLRTGARGQCIRILDKYTRFTPERHTSAKFIFARAYVKDGVYTGVVGIASPDGMVPAAVIRFDPE